MIYLDNNATTPVDPDVRLALMYALEKGFGNPSSAHAAGRESKKIIDNARLSIASLLKCGPDEIYFTSGGTESNNLAILGAAMRHGKGHIITSAIEHPSVLNTVKALEDKGFSATYAGVDGYGRVIVDEIAKAVRNDTILVTVMHSNNETGVLQPVGEIHEIANKKGVAFHTDAAQSIGKVPVDSSMCDMMTIVGHKFYAPKGIGALYVGRSVRNRIQPILYGAGHEQGLRPGTENVSSICALGKACQIVSDKLESWVKHMSEMNAAFSKGILSAAPNARINGHPTLRLPNTINISLPNVDAVGLVERVGLRLAISSGSACHAGIKKPSSVLKAMGVSDADAMSAIRVSIGKDNTPDEIQEAIRILSGNP